MVKKESKPKSASAATGGPDVPFGSNCVRLSRREWIAAAIILLAAFCFGPALWERIEKFEPGPDYRLPYASGYDYWLYGRYCRWAHKNSDALVIGDSVVWGHYVDTDGTLSHYLSRDSADLRFANMGVDGAHPAALAGLLRYYGRAVTGRKVVLHLNPLWMTSKKQDLQTEKQFRFNHSRLVPQFFPRIPCYWAPYSKRLSVAIERYLPFFAWTSHLRISYFDSMDLPAWTVEHPYANPLKAVTLVLPEDKRGKQDEIIGRGERAAAPGGMDWVELEGSLQWRFFRDSVKILKARGNTVFVLVGPFNEHRMGAEDLAVYRKIQGGIETWLRQNDVPYFMPPALPAALYVDASHPVAEGYASLAAQLIRNAAFRSAILGRSESAPAD
ncbi:MAG: hypothetical protein JSU94_03920 [Phycisphaerales bacterium]|nr:MAG: hypothetical protein JSU94_03920 [Phycisphaerales bacterium]